jgi:SAM-dependent methyltransferase
VSPARRAPPRLLNVGGGSKAIALPRWYAGFEHVLLDIDPAGAPDILADARALCEQPAAGFDAVYCSHNLEHYRAHEVPAVLAGIRHVLRPGGFAEIRVPDLGAVMREVVARGLDIEDRLYLSPRGPVTVRDVIYGYGPEIARSGRDFYAHRTGFTEASLARALRAAGFPVLVRRPGRAYELVLIGFGAPPTGAQTRLLGLRLDPAEG